MGNTFNVFLMQEGGSDCGVDGMLCHVTWHLFTFSLVSLSEPSSVVGIATGYRLDGPGIESRWGRDFPHLSRLALETTQPPVQ